MTDIAGDITTTTELLPGGTLVSDLGFLGDIDVVLTQAQIGLAYAYELTTTSAVLDLDLRLLRNDGLLLSRVTGANGDPVSLSFTATDTTYFAYVGDSANNDVGDYELTFNADDTIVNSIATTETLAAGATLGSAIDVVGDIDVIATAVTEGLSYAYELTTTSAVLDLDLRLLRTDGLLLSRVMASDGDPVSLSFTANDTTTQFAYVGDSANNDVGDYELTFNADDTILNSIATTETLAAGATLGSAIDVVGDIDVIATAVTEGLSYAYELTTTSAVLDLDLRLLLTDGLLLSRVTASDGDPVSLSFTATDTTTQFAYVGDSANNDVGDYELTFNADDTILNSVATTETLDPGYCLQSALDVVGDIDVIGFGIVAGVTYELSVSTASTVLDLDLRLLRTDGLLLSRVTGSDGDPVSLSFTATDTTTQFAYVGDSANNDVGDYALVITADTADDLTGTGGNDKLYGGAGADTLSGFAGDDYLSGGADNDVLRGSSGADTLEGDGGDDVIFGGDDGDVADGGDGADEIDAGNGNDSVSGGAGNDLLKGGQDNDSLFGEDGADTLRGGAGDDELYGGEGDDELSGSDDADLLFGDAGNDLLLGDGQSDTLYGGDGADTLRGGGADDVLHGDAGDDLMFGSSGFDTLYGGDGDDVLEGNQQGDALFGEAGNDTLRGGDGFDALDGGDGADVLVGDNGNDTLDGGAGQDILRGLVGNDTFRFLSVADSAFGLADLIDGIEGVGASGGDVIDLSAIDADVGTAGDQAFTFIGEATTAVGLAGGAGTLWLETVGAQTRIYGIVDNDATVDLAIRINDGAVLAADYTGDDFLL